MSSARLKCVSSGRGSIVKLSPLVPDLEDWFDNRLDWDATVSVVDMFSGAGGLSFGLDSLDDVSVVAAFEQDEKAAETHRANMAGAAFTGDVRDVASFEVTLKEVGIRRVDLLAGGPPCQGFSRLGKGALRRLALEDGRGVDLSDARNWLFREFIRAVIELGPAAVMMENVPEMAACEPVMEELAEVFADMGYWTDHKILSAEEYGVPQRRRRLFIVAGHSNQGAFFWPTRTSSKVTVRQAISDLPSVPHSHMNENTVRPAPSHMSSYASAMRRGLRGQETRLIRDHVTRVHRPEDIKAFGLMSEGDRYTDIPAELRRYRDDIFTDKYHRMIWDEPTWTVTAHLSKDGYKYIHPDQPRTISVREAARLQSFPDRFRFAGSRTDRFRQVGNAVPPRLAQAVGGSLVSTLR